MFDFVQKCQKGYVHRQTSVGQGGGQAFQEYNRRRVRIHGEYIFLEIDIEMRKEKLSG